MQIDLCKLFGVEEGEEFKIEHISCEGLIYKIQDNCLKRIQQDSKNFTSSGFGINKINEITNIIKLPKKKEFTDDELCILRHIDSEFNILGKNINGTIYVTSDCEKTYLKPFNNLFQILDVGEEIRIDDYVER